MVLLALLTGGIVLALWGKPVMTRIRTVTDQLWGTNNSRHPRITKNTPIEQQLTILLGQLETKPDDIAFDTLSHDSLLAVQARVPNGIPIELVVRTLSDGLTRSTYSISDAFYNNSKRECRLELTSSSASPALVSVRLTRAHFFHSATAQMAIVFDRFQFSPNRTSVEILSFSHPLTLRILGSPDQTPLSAQVAGEYKKELIIALPMEPHIRPSSFPFDRAIMVHHSPEQIRERLEKCMRAVPQFSGFSNWEGSRVMEDSRVTEILLAETRKRHAYFLAYKPNSRSLFKQKASEMGVPYEEVDAAIDGSGLTAEEVGARLQHLAVVARSRGRMIVALPSSESAIDALNDRLQLLTENGIRLTYVSDIVNRSPFYIGSPQGGRHVDSGD